MGWLKLQFHSLFSPLKKLWSRIRPPCRKSGEGIYVLYEDVKSCPSEDVHVLWSILVETHLPPSSSSSSIRCHEKAWQFCDQPNV
ncbi:hypothetical protein LINGRAHAP2_LOCUS32070 [Linum grandiflorum]